MITTSFWVAVLYALFFPHKDMRWFVLGLAGGLVSLFVAHLVAGRLIPAPIREGLIHPAAGESVRPAGLIEPGAGDGHNSSIINRLMMFHGPFL